MLDYHLHSAWSHDGQLSMAELCRYAIQNEMTEIAITDHMDYNLIPKPQRQLQNLEGYFTEAEACQREFANRLTIRIGVEIGMEREHLEEAHRFVNGYPFDFVIGSVHELDGGSVSKPWYFQGKTKEQVYRRYYSGILDCIREFSDFDVLGHLDYSRRYLPQPYEETDPYIAIDLVDEILHTLLRTGKGIEMNTSGFRHVSHMPLPHYDIASRYFSMGGRRITIGSDGHRPEYLQLEIPAVTKKLKELGFTHLSTFSRREEQFVAIEDILNE